MARDPLRLIPLRPSLLDPDKFLISILPLLLHIGGSSRGRPSPADHAALLRCCGDGACL